MTVFLALLKDSYRELNSKKLFWIILILSFLVVLFYLSMGFDETGMFFFFGLMHNDTEYLVAGSPLSGVLYRSIFATFMVGTWLAWIATILALISTTTIFPDFVAGGAIDMVLAKPISRVKLFAIKYVVSLMFVLLQVAIFCVGIFFCIGVRLGDWDWRVFLAIPIVILFFSYLFSVNVLLGVWTRSAITALLLTLLFWFGLYSTNQAEGIVNQFATVIGVQNEASTERVAQLEQRIASASDEQDVESMRAQLEQQRTELTESEGLEAKLDWWLGFVHSVQTPLPKTSETIGLLDRWLTRDSDIGFMDIMTGNIEQLPDGSYRAAGGGNDGEAMRRMQDDYESRSGWYITGTSLAFEAVILALACWIFVRRDY